MSVVVAGSGQHAWVTAARSASRPFQPGDQVRVWRGFYWHHAVYIGNGWFIEFGSGVLGGVVEYVAESDLARGSDLHFVRAGGRQAVQRAESWLGRGGFNLMSANCEHFATWCTTGQWQSAQVDNAMVVGGFALIGAMLLACAK